MLKLVQITVAVDDTDSSRCYGLDADGQVWLLGTVSVGESARRATKTCWKKIPMRTEAEANDELRNESGIG